MTIGPQPEPHPAWRRRRNLVVFVLGVALAVTVIVFSRRTSQAARVVWLTPAGTNHASARGPLIQLKNQFLDLTSPLWPRRPNPQTPFQTVERWMVLSAAVVAEAAPGAPLATNAFGQRAWILNSAQLQDFQLHLEGNPGARILGQPGFSTAAWRARNDMDAGSYQRRPRNLRNRNANLALKKLSNSYQLDVNASWSAWTDPQPELNQIACRAIIPEGCCLVLDSASPAGREGTYWFIFTPGPTAPSEASTQTRIR